MKTAFWQGKKVLVTGHTGFKGAWLCLLLRHLGAEVFGYALDPPTQPNMFSLCRVADGMQSEIGDIRDASHFSEYLRKVQPEVLIHMAAQPLVRRSYQEPVETYDVNVMGTVHVLESVRNCRSLRAVIIVTTDKCYENREWIWGYREKSPLGGKDPYSSSKACAELVVTAYRHSFFSPDAKSGIGIASARAGNVIGGGDWAEDRLVPDILNGLVNGRHVEIRNPQAIRPWQHVLEPLWGYLVLAEKLYQDPARYGEGWNFGPNEASIQTVQWIVEHLHEAWNVPVTWKKSQLEHPPECTLLKLDAAKARTFLGWRPRLDLNTCLNWIVDWTKTWQARKDLHQETLRQIESYLALPPHP